MIVLKNKVKKKNQIRKTQKKKYLHGLKIIKYILDHWIYLLLHI